MEAVCQDVELLVPPPSIPRGKGVHVSGIIRDIALSTGVLKSDGIEEPSMSDVRMITDPVAILRICIGLSWEEYYLGVFLKRKGILKHPGEICVDGIYMQPDGVERGVMITRVHEVKATYKSINTVGDMRGQWLWLTQVKAYCKGLNTTYAKIHVLFLCGDYKMPIRPMVKEWTLEFTQHEIDDNWAMLRDYRDYREGRCISQI
jgi:hypothetical protein